MVGGLQAFAEALKEDRESIPKKFNSRNMSLNLEAQAYSPQRVREARAALGASQAVFALFLGVSVKTVQAWEQGENPPQHIACRMMDEILHDPAYWQQRLQELAVEKV
ncbi:MAG: helix-turn-helix domain-containing protein [Planctomycetaceae bacterium]|nr:helix-turn-helix domain-containing protein [Planctomycetaceae bacterium]